MEYYNTDAFGNTIYIDVETEEMYSFTPEEMEVANEREDLSVLPWNEEHIITKFYN